MVCVPERQEMFLETLRGFLEPTRVREGCRSCELWESIEDPGRFLLEQEWNEPFSLGKYLESKMFRQLLVATDCLSEPPRIFLKDLPGETEAETIQALYESVGTAIEKTRPAPESGTKGRWPRN
jgi:quinol monooxygenase YgiN